MNDIKLIDIHTHLVPNVDDGVNSLTLAIEIIKSMIEDGVKEIILTPHKQSNRSKGTIKDIKESFKRLESEVFKLGLPIKLHLGYELRYYTHLRPDYHDLVISDTQYLFVEFDSHFDPNIEQVISYITSLGLKLIIAHIERYKYLKYDDIVYFRNLGVLVQVNAKTIYNPTGFRQKRLIRKLLKNKQIDFIASDVHNDTTRTSDLKIAYDKLMNKVDKKYLNDIFYQNAFDIIHNSK